MFVLPVWTASEDSGAGVEADLVVAGRKDPELGLEVKEVAVESLFFDLLEAT